MEAFRETPYQVILSMGTNSECFGDLPDNIQVYESVDQMAVLSISDVFLTHCGMNSVSEGLYFQVPLILFPQTPEQGAVAKRTEELGAGIHLQSIEPHEIVQAVNEILQNRTYKDNAAKISQSFQACGGAKEARRFLETVAGRKEMRGN